MVDIPRSTVTATGRPIAPGGWRRAVVGVLVGAVVGVLAVVTGRPRGD